MVGFKFNKVYVIESLNSINDKLTGKELFNDLLKWKEFQIKDFKAELIQVDNKGKFFEQLKYIKSECTVKGYLPILHFEIHGCKDKTGLVLSSGELIRWSELYEDLVEINILVKNNLFLTMAVCHGAYIMEVIKTTNPSPFWGFIGSFDTINVSDLLIRYNEFYNELLSSFDISKATKSLHESNPGIPSKYKFINSELAFENIYKSYIKEKFTESQIEERFMDGMKQNGFKLNNRNEVNEIKIKFKIELLITKEKYFEKHKKVFFMIDRYKSNANRFKLSYKDLQIL